MPTNDLNEKKKNFNKNRNFCYIGHYLIFSSPALWVISLNIKVNKIKESLEIVLMKWGWDLLFRCFPATCLVCASRF